MSAPVTIGTRLGRYEILSKIGEGGMGEVYLARDVTGLDRSVAIKVLPTELAADSRRMQRFLQEARTVSTLNHPNILTIYEFGQSGSRRYIASEYVDGATLRDQMCRRRLKPAEALEIAAQIAAALDAAHEAKVVHRDIKPENVMLRRRDHIVKVLDFGLAKPLEEIAAATGLPVDTEAGTKPLINTEPGLLLGTVAYMSPEQSRGEEVDHRTDIWSLGVVLYEMVAGRLPFEGADIHRQIISIQEHEPPPLSRHADEVPERLEEIVSKALAKDAGERYQTAKDLLIDLRNLRRRLDVDAEIDRTGAPELHAVTGGARPPRAGRPSAALTATEIARPTSSAEYVIGELRRHKAGALVAAAGLAAALALAYAALRLSRTAPGQPPPSQPAMKITRLPGAGRAAQAAISPDGKYVVHVASQDARQSLRVRQVNVASGEQEIMPPAEVRYTGLSFSPDGESLYYVAAERNAALASLYQVPVLGGTPRRIASNVGSPATFSPDGKRLAFVRDLVEQGEQVLVIAGAEGGGERVVAVRKFPNFFKSVSWSPDGKTFACAVGSYVPDYNSYVVTMPVEGGAEKKVSGQTWLSIGQLAWLPDGGGLALSASELGSGSFDSSQLWLVTYPAGEVRRVTNDLNNYTGVSLTADSSRVVTVQSATLSNLWLVPRGEAARAAQISSGVSQGDGRKGVAWTPDGRVVYVSKEGGGEDLWVMNADGTGKKQLTSAAGINNHPAVSPDGRFVVFTSTRAGAPHIVRMSADGSDVTQLTSGSGEDFAQFSPDGQWVVYTLFAGKPTLWRVSAEGGAPSPLTQELASSPAISPDGKLIAVTYWGESAASPARIAVIPSEGGAALKVFEPPYANWGSVRWSPDGRSLVYVVTVGGVSNLLSQPLAGGDPKPLTDFKDLQIFSFDWSREGDRIVCARGVEANDVVLISNFR